MDNPAVQIADNQSVASNSMVFGKRVAGIVFFPGKVMESLIEKPGILFPLLANLLGLLALYLLKYPLFLEFLRETIEASTAASQVQIPPEQMDTVVKIASITSLISTPIVAVISWLIVSTVLFGAGKILKGQGSFKQYMSVTGYSYVITLTYLLLSLVASFFSGQLLINASLSNITNIFAPQIKGTYLYGVINGIDLFAIWQFCIIGIGINRLSKLGKVKSYLPVIVVFIISVLLNAPNIKFNFL